MAYLREWVRGLVVLIVLGSVLELLLPMGSMKKFVRMAMGLLIILGVVRPMVALLGQPVQVDPGLLVDERPALPTMQQIAAEAGRFREKTREIVLREAQQRLAAEVEAAARGVDGVTDAQATVRVAAGPGLEGYRVEEVTVTVRTGSPFGQVRPVEPVKVEPKAGSARAPGDASPAQLASGAELRLADAVRRAVAAQLGLPDARLIQVLVDRPGQPRR